MAKDTIQIDDSVQPNIVQDVAPERQNYIVTSEVGLFKNGTQYNVGDEINLDVKAAQKFIDNGEVQ